MPWSGFSNIRSDTTPINFESLQLPATLLSLELKSGFNSRNLEVLLMNELPKLKHLVIKFNLIPLENDLISRILHRLRTSLTSLRLEGFGGQGRPHSFIKLPHMEKLENILVSCIRCELEFENSSPLQSVLPKIKTVVLVHHDEALLANWITNSKF